MDNEERETESSYEFERRMKRERAKQDYLDRHPFHKDKVDIKPMKAVIELAQKYFEDNPNSDEFQLEKAVLGSKLGIGSTKTLSVCNALAGEYEFIDDGRGLITIDRKGFQNWIKLREELEKERERNLNQHKEAKVLNEEIEKFKKGNEDNDKILADMRSGLQGLKEGIAKKEEELKALPEQIEALEKKYAQLNADFEKQDEEKKNREKALEAHLIAQKEFVKRKESERNWLVRSPITDYYYEDSIFWKLVKGFGWFCGYFVFFYVIIWILNYFF